MTTAEPKLHGRRKGRPLHARKSMLVRDLLAHVQITLPLNVEQLFDFMPESLWLEIGFGGGEHVAALAEQHPDTGFIGCEPFLNGIAGLLNHIDKQSLKNVRIYPDDARVLLDAMPDQSVARCYLLFPDPWPKARHANRRFIGQENLTRLARVLAKGAELHLATDDAQLAVWMREQATAHPAFTALYDSTEPPDDWVATRYEAKGKEAGRKPVYFKFARKT